MEEEIQETLLYTHTDTHIHQELVIHSTNIYWLRFQTCIGNWRIKKIRYREKEDESEEKGWPCGVVDGEQGPGVGRPGLQASLWVVALTLSIAELAGSLQGATAPGFRQNGQINFSWQLQGWNPFNSCKCLSVITMTCAVLLSCLVMSSSLGPHGG